MSSTARATPAGDHDSLLCVCRYESLSYLYDTLHSVFCHCCSLLFSIHAIAVSGQPHKSELSPHNSSTAPPCSPISSQGQATKPAPQAQLQVSSTALAGATPAGNHDSLLISYMCNTFRSLYVSRQHVLVSPY